MKRKMTIIGILILTLASGYLCSYTVNEREWVVITQFGRPVRTVKDTGLHFKLPGIIQKVNRFEKRINTFESQLIQLLLGDKNPIILSCYVAWRIDNPLTFFQAVNCLENATPKLSDMVNSQLGGILGDYTIDNIINIVPEKVKMNKIEERLMVNSNKMARERYGIQIVQIGIRRIAYPSIVSNAVYERMKSERRKESNKLRAEGREEATKIEAIADKEAKDIMADAYKSAQIIKGKGDKEAMKIYAEAYGKDPEFFDFLKSLETYEKILKTKSTLILSTESELFKYLSLEDKNSDE